MRTQEPTVRITRYLRRIGSPGPGVPFEAECTACADAKFNIPHDKRKEYGGYFHQPQHEYYVQILTRGFRDHVDLVHPEFAAKVKASAE